jgi:formylglycine-generating enzyme required for sulfatase activity
MHGNVAEWCLDWRGDYPGGSVRDWPGPWSDDWRTCRGGSWDRGPDYLRSADRGQAHPNDRDSAIGFRVACYP